MARKLDRLRVFVFLTEQVFAKVHSIDEFKTYGKIQVLFRGSCTLWSFVILGDGEAASAGVQMNEEDGLEFYFKRDIDVWPREWARLIE